jgi:hypothetical protein
MLATLLSVPSYMYQSNSDRKSKYSDAICGSLESPQMSNQSNVSAMRPSFKVIYFTLNVFILFFLPFLIMTVMYVIIIAKLLKDSNRFELPDAERIRNQNNKKTILLLVLILLTFFTCWYVRVYEFKEKKKIFSIDV